MILPITYTLAAYLLGGALTFLWFRRQPEYQELLHESDREGGTPWRASVAMLIVTLAWWPLIPVCGLLAARRQFQDRQS